MIVRILGEDQLEVPDAELVRLSALDQAVVAACANGDRAECAAALTALLEGVREAGFPLVTDEPGPSDLVLPSADASLAEVSALLTTDGLISP